MISFKELGKRRLGNQLFQYAFLRITARRLGVRFYCPKWLGDDIFLLRDEKERAEKPIGIDKTYKEDVRNCGFNQDALRIKDRTDIIGFFQSEKYFPDKEIVKKWFRVKEEMISPLREKYRHIDFSKSVGLHCRFGDKENLLHYVIMPLRYYVRALSCVKHKQNILIFSDKIDKAKRVLKNLKGNIIFMKDNKSYEDLYLMGLCHDFVCSDSTLSWWGAWLNQYKDKTIVAPREWIRPGYRIKNDNLCCDGWVSIKTVQPIVGDYRVIVFLKRFRQKINCYLSRLKR